MNQTDRRLLLLSPADNVLVARAPITEGEPICVEGVKLSAASAFSLGHKLARRPIAAGEPIIKYGAVIGSTTADIPQDAHVHTHNVRSNYTATHTLEEARTAYEAAREAGKASVDEVGQEIYDLVLEAAAGCQTCSEAMGHAEFILTYKSIEPIRPACLPA